MKKFAVMYGRVESAVQRRAIEILSRTLLDHVGAYPACLPSDKGLDFEEYRCIYVGTKQTNDYIREHSTVTLTHAEEYHIKVVNADETVIIEGSDDNGVLYGCVDFYNRYIVGLQYVDDVRYCVPAFDGRRLADFECTSYPSVKNRGLWTWGHVIYDYRGYIDHMVKLKMNTLIIWNDYAPLNAADLVRYAHENGVKIIWGFAWGWDADEKRITAQTLRDRSSMERSREILALYERDYAQLGGDGIYFQSFTEFDKDVIEGCVIAELVTEFVNRTASLYYEKHPELEILFGLHATSVKEKLDYIQNVDPRICIVWEDCGAFPFAYVPRQLDTFDETAALIERIAVLRGKEDRFGVVTKSFTNLDWSKFSHLGGPVCLGNCSKAFKERTLADRKKFWKYMQAYWMTNADKALSMVRLMARAKDGDLYVTPLVEDGMFEAHLPFALALYSEMLWDAEGDVKDIMTRVALRDDVEFA